MAQPRATQASTQLLITTGGVARRCGSGGTKIGWGLHKISVISCAHPKVLSCVISGYSGAWGYGREGGGVGGVGPFCVTQGVHKSK